MSLQLEQDLKRTLELITPSWRVQNNFTDRRTNFIYNITTLNQCLSQIQFTGVDKDYALHRWFNYHTSKHCETIFTEFGATPEPDKYNHDIDIYINGVPFDVKLTVYPAKLAGHPYDPTTRDGKDMLIRWYYANQSQQARKQMVNRIYVVCDANDERDRLSLKSDFNFMREQISIFMKDALAHGVNPIQITDYNNVFNIHSDIVYIKK